VVDTRAAVVVVVATVVEVATAAVAITKVATVVRSVIKLIDSHSYLFIGGGGQGYQQGYGGYSAGY
jgi:hypothetical protein